MTNEELLAETSIRANAMRNDFYKTLRLVLLKYMQGDRGPEYDLNVLVDTAQTCCRGYIESKNRENALYFLDALYFLQHYRFKKMNAALEELKYAYATATGKIPC
jgi:hypothetical protein